MRVLGYAGGLTPGHRLADEGAVVFHDMRELPRLLAGGAAEPAAPEEPAAVVPPAGTAGYGAEADALAVQYESVAFEEVQRGLLALFPAAPARVLDVGAGTGRDAAALARLGHRVTAVEPTAELRAHGRRLHADTAIRWVDDALPGLPRLRASAEQYDLILITAVWMHLDPAERAEGIRTVAELLAPGGTLAMTVRSGPVPTGRLMFEVPAGRPRRWRRPPACAWSTRTPAPTCTAGPACAGRSWGSCGSSRLTAVERRRAPSSGVQQPEVPVRISSVRYASAQSCSSSSAGRRARPASVSW